MLKVKKVGNYVSILLGNKHFYVNKELEYINRGKFITKLSVLGNKVISYEKGTLDWAIWEILKLASKNEIYQSDLNKILVELNDDIDYREFKNDLDTVKLAVECINFTLPTYRAQYYYSTIPSWIDNKHVKQLSGNPIETYALNHSKNRKRSLENDTLLLFSAQSIMAQRFEKDCQYATHYLFRDQNNIIPVCILNSLAIERICSKSQVDLQITVESIKELFKLGYNNPDNIRGITNYVLRQLVKICKTFKCSPKLVLETWTPDRLNIVTTCIKTKIPAFKNAIKTTSITDVESIEYMSRLTNLSSTMLCTSRKGCFDTVTNYDTVLDDLLECAKQSHMNGDIYAFSGSFNNLNQSVYDGFNEFIKRIWYMSPNTGYIDYVGLLKMFVELQDRYYSFDYISPFTEDGYTYIDGNNIDLYYEVARINKINGFRATYMGDLIYSACWCALIKDNSYIKFALSNKNQLIIDNIFDWTDEQLKKSIEIIKKHIKKPIKKVYISYNHTDTNMVRLSVKLIGHGRSRVVCNCAARDFEC